MATSGSTNFSQTCDALINDAFQLIGIYGVGRTVNAADMQLARRMLNKMVKAWGAKGLHLWAKEEAILFLTPYTNDYILGTAKAALASDTLTTQLTTAVVATTTALTVTSTAGMTVGDYIGVVLTDKTVHWTTIATLPTSTTLTLTTGVTGAASASTLIYTFTTLLGKPLRVLDARLLKGFDSGTSSSTLSEYNLTSVSYEEYYSLPSKVSAGSVNQFHYNPKNTSGVMHVWPRPIDGGQRIQFTFERQLEDLDNASDDFDFPAEWLEALTYQLALRLGPPFGKDQRAMNSIAPLASAMLQDLLEWDKEITSISMLPDLGWQ